jgi:hypothetical protein
MKTDQAASQTTETMTNKKKRGIAKMHWFEENEDIHPLQAVKRACRHYHRKYGQVPKLVELPPSWRSFTDELEDQLEGLTLSTDALLQPRTVAVTHITESEAE